MTAPRRATSSPLTDTYRANAPSVLFDKHIRRGRRPHLQGHTVRTTQDAGCSALQNNDLLTAAEQPGSRIMPTADRRIRHQQNLAARRLARVVLSSPAWPLVQAHISGIKTAVNATTPGSYQEIDLLGHDAATR